ncbi:universal stress protein [Haladaptatus sp. W1]|uniref:universal stress protein n=1 Tax=Haladaptatus sp. W1 TaxID=1897478 RepID=UPI000849AADB|nr:universal stress protein [Haladaptatus sp. W1]ODR81004.1 universal stress protein [Haladaptatus sp. W1]
MYSHIVIAVDGSDEANRAARRGLAFAGEFDATVDVLHVVERKALGLTTSADEAERLRERGERILGDIEDIASERGQSVTTALREGKPAVQISEFAAERDADLLVIGRQGKSGMEKQLLGGVTEQLLHRNAIPVFVVPKDGKQTVKATDYARILIPTDGSENADVAVPHGIEIARRYDSAVHVLNVVDLQVAGGAFDAGGLETEFIERLDERGQAAVEKVAGEVEEGVSRPVETAVERTTSFEGAAAGIQEYVEENNIELVVMASHGRSNVGRQFLGSVTSTLLRTVDVPVVVVKRSS